MEDLAVLVAIVSLLLFAGWLAYEASYHACAQTASRLAEMQAEEECMWALGYAQGHSDGRKVMAVAMEKAHKKELKKHRETVRRSTTLDLRQKLRLRREVEEMRAYAGQVKLRLVEFRRQSMPEYHEKVEDLLWMFDANGNVAA